MKIKNNKSVFLFIVGGGVIGFIFHLIWHYTYNIQLFNFDSHIVQGTLYTLIGIVLGIFIWFLLQEITRIKKEK